MYDRGYGRHGGWEMRMEHGDHGYDRGYRDPRQGRGGPAERPWVGGYRGGYQGGSGGYSVGTTGPLYDTRGYADDYHERGYRRPRGARPSGGGGVRMRGSARDLDPSFGRGEHGDTFAYNDERGGTAFGGRTGGGGDGGRYGRDYGRGMRGYAREFQNEGRPEDYHPRYSPVGGTWGPMGGSQAAYRAGRPPRPVSDTHWTSEETRWF